MRRLWRAKFLTGLDVVRLDDQEDDVLGAKDAQRSYLYAELLGELRDLAGPLLKHLPRLSVGGRAEVGRMLGDDGKRWHDGHCSFR